MKSIHRIIIVLLFVSTPLAHAEKALQTISMAPNGATVITSDSGKIKVWVKVKTHAVQIGKPSDKRPNMITSSCTYSKYPCSLVDSIEISVNGKPIHVPRSVFCDLADLNNGNISAGQKVSILTLSGGDASESYLVKIEFDAERITRRTIFNPALPDQALEVTVYNKLILDDSN